MASDSADSAPQLSRALGTASMPPTSLEPLQETSTPDSASTEVTNHVSNGYTPEPVHPPTNGATKSSLPTNGSAKSLSKRYQELDATPPRPAEFGAPAYPGHPPLSASGGAPRRSGSISSGYGSVAGGDPAMAAAAAGFFGHSFATARLLAAAMIPPNADPLLQVAAGHTLLLLYQQHVLEQAQPLAGSYAAQAITSLRKAVQLEPITFDNTRATLDLLLIIIYWFEFDTDPAVHAAVLATLKELEASQWLPVLPQILSRIQKCSPQAAQVIQKLLKHVGKPHLQAVLWPLLVLQSSTSVGRNSVGSEILRALQDLSPEHKLAIEQANNLSKEMLRVAKLPQETWQETLEEAGREYFTNGNADESIETIRKTYDEQGLIMHARTSALNLYELQFKEQFWGKITEVMQLFDQYLEGRAEQERARIDADTRGDSIGSFHATGPTPPLPTTTVGYDPGSTEPDRRLDPTE